MMKTKLRINGIMADKFYVTNHYSYKFLNDEYLLQNTGIYRIYHSGYKPRPEYKFNVNDKVIHGVTLKIIKKRIMILNHCYYISNDDLILDEIQLKYANTTKNKRCSIR